jgi:phosphoglycerate dehydrogenase-like enzyme
VNGAARLRWIHTPGAGIDQLQPLAELREDLVLSNSSGIHGDKAGESALMAVLLLNARMPQVWANQQRRVWEAVLTASVRGRQVLLIGFGDIGQAVARALAPLGVRLAAVTRSGRPADGSPPVDRIVPTAQLDELLPAADFVIVTAPLTPGTHNLLDEFRLARLPRGAGLVNMARAGLVDYVALARLLRAGHLCGAVLDVFDAEPLGAESPFWDVPSMVVTPHITCDAPDYAQRVLDLWFGNFERLRTGEPLFNQVDRARGY